MKRLAYLGIDIGTTNTKCLVLTEEEGISKVVSLPTAKVVSQGRTYFDIKKIEQVVDSFITTFSKDFEVISVGFSSIGESVVPIKNGRACANPILWNERVCNESKEDQDFIKEHTGFEVVGTKDNGLFALHKILFDKSDADLYLPLCSYLAYRKTGFAAWDFSQACRSLMFDINKREWIFKLVEHFKIPLDCPVLMMGESLGTKDGITYGLGGHDHQVGFFGIRSLFKDREVVYNSMGTSSVIAYETHSPKFSPMGCTLPSKAEAFIETKSNRRFGSFLSYIRELCGFEGLDYQQINKRLLDDKSEKLTALFSVDGDILRGTDGSGTIDITYLVQNPSAESLLKSAYSYLCVLSKIGEGSLTSGSYLAVSGGGITQDEVFMDFLAQAEGGPIVVLDTSEISSLGAALVGLKALGNVNAISKISSKISYKMVYPSGRFKGLIEDAKSRYAYGK